MGERGSSDDHSTIQRWVVHFAPLLADRFNRRKRAVDSNGDTVQFWLSEHRDLSAAKRFFRKAFARHGRPERIVIDGSLTNREAINSCGAINRFSGFAFEKPASEQPHRAGSPPDQAARRADARLQVLQIGSSNIAVLR